MEIYRFVDNRLELVKDCQINGRITWINSIKSVENDYIVVVTAKYQLAIYSWSVQFQDLQVEYTVDIKDPGARPCQSGIIGLVDENSKLIAIHQSQGLLKIIPIDFKGKSKLQEPFNVRLTTLDVLSIQFLNKGSNDLEMAVLHRDHREFANLKVFQVKDKNSELKEVAAFKVDDTAEFIIPVANSLGGGILVVARNNITWFGTENTTQIVGSDNLKWY